MARDLRKLDRNERRMGKPRLYRQGTSWYVIGESDFQKAAALLRASTSTDHWAGSFGGMFTRRKYGWTNVQCDHPLTTPKDARPGVMFTVCRDKDGELVRSLS